MKSLLDKVVVDPSVLSGKPVIKGTRIPVELILEKLAAGESVEDLLRDYPRLSKEQIQAALAYSQKVVAGEEVYPLG